MRAFVIALALVVSGPAVAQMGTLEWGYCRLYPSKCVRPAPHEPAPAPTPEPPAAQPEHVLVPPPTPAALPAPAPVATAPVVAKPAPRPKPAAKPLPRVKSKFKKARKRYTAAELAAMPGLIWPCWVVRAKTAGKSKAQLIAEGRAQGISLNPRQIKEVCECGVKAACGSA